VRWRVVIAGHFEVSKRVAGRYDAVRYERRS
jgi:hypothetical protein